MNRKELQEYLKSRNIFRSDGHLNTTFILHGKFPSELEDYEGNSKQEKIWNLFNDRQGCAICNKPTEFISYNKGYKKTCCKQCNDLYLKNSSQKAWDNRSEEERRKIQEKREQTNLEKSGFKNPGLNPEVQAKMKETNIKNHGKEYYFQTDEFKEKSKATNNSKYGYDYALSSPEVIAKRTQTLLSKHGVSNSKNIPGVLEKQYEKFEQDLKEGKTIFTLQNCHLNEKYVGQYSGPNNQLPMRKYKFECELCGNIFYDTFEHTNTIIRCPDCFKSHNRSYWEVEICDWLSEYIEIEKTNRTILNGKELDIYIPSKKIAIECDGVYYHSEKFVDKNYHLNKTLECEKQGIRLIHIFEDEWLEKKEIIKSIILSSLGIYERKIGARECEVHLDNCRDFFEENHLQGAASGKICYYLTYKDEIVAALMIGKPRFNEGYDYEILRFAVKLNTNVPGAFNKLFKEFKKDHHGKVITYSDRRLFNGNLYRNNFKELTPSKPGYSYSSNINRIPRYKMTKERLLEKYPEDSNLTEHLIANKHGYFRIYDCGQFRFEVEV